MAKGQLRGNREAKKPKQEKPKAPVVESALTARLNAGTGKQPKGGRK